MARGRLFMISHAGMGPLLGKGPRVIVSADVSVLPQSMFVCGGATGAALKGTHVRLWNIQSMTLVRLSSPAICCIGPGPICVYYELSPVDEFVVPANARFGWFSGSTIVKDRAPTISEYNVEHANTLIAQVSPFLRYG
ncbi:hypothetical protein Tco_1036095, partial [Tanacetum coccineum]